MKAGSRIVLPLLLTLTGLIAGCEETGDQAVPSAPVVSFTPTPTSTPTPLPMIDRERAVDIAKASIGAGRDAVINARLEERLELELRGVKKEWKVWIVEAVFPSKNKEVYYIDAEQGAILILSEMEPPFDTPPITPLEVRLEENDEGFGFRLEKGNADQRTEVQSVVAAGGTYAVHLIRSMKDGPGVKLYRMDVLLVDVPERTYRLIPLADVGVQDAYSVDSLTRVHGFQDASHAILLQPVQDVNGSMSYDLVSLNVMTGVLETRMKQVLPDWGTDFLAAGWVHAPTNRLFVNSFSGGQLWSFDWERGKKQKWEGNFKSGWPLVRTFPSPDGERVWYTSLEGESLYDGDGKWLKSIPLENRLREHPPYEWSPTGQYSVSELAKDDNAAFMLEGEEGVYDVASQELRIYDREGRPAWSLQVPADQSETFVEWGGWLADGSRGLLRRYELERTEGAVPQKVKSAYSVLDVPTGLETPLRQAGSLQELTHPEPVAQADEQGRLLVVDPAAGMYVFLNEAGERQKRFELLSSPLAPYIIWSETDFNAGMNVIRRYERASGTLVESRFPGATGAQLHLAGSDDPFVFDSTLFYRRVR